MKKNFRWKKTRYAALQTAGRAVLGIIICAAAISTVYIGRKPYGEGLKEGDISLRTIYAPIDFQYHVGIDKEKTKEERQKATEAVDEVYEIKTQTNQGLLEKLDKFFSRIILVQNLKEIEEEEKAERVKSGLEIDISVLDLKAFLADSKPEETRTKSKTLLKELLSKGIISESLKERIAKSGRKYVVLKIDPAQETKVSIDRFLILDKAKKEIAAEVQNLVPEERKLRIALINLIEKALEPNLRFNEELTNKRRQLAYDNAPLQYKENEVKKEELIIARGERVAREDLLKIKEVFRRQVKVNRFMFFSGATILTLIFLGIFSIYLKSYEPRIFLSTRKLTLVGILFILILILAKVITYSPLPSYAIPAAIVPILIAMLISPRLAIIVAVVLSIFIGIIAGDKLNITIVSFVGAVVGVFFIRDSRRRSQILVTGCLVGMANFLSICAIELLHGLKYTVFLKQGFWGIINGLGSAVIITGVLPVFEGLFNLTTNISLLELSDLNHPLLKEMVLKAPGTYHHSLIVGNLAEAASEAIGANALLARVGSYFHDIGKTEKAGYFSENQLGAAKKRHDSLTPSMSSLIITNHVKDGVELARKYKLNQAVIDFIEQHHGTSLIFYFYQRALEKAEEEVPMEEGFRYPGPKPQTKETAVVLLADSVEAASRALSEPTPARIKGLVRKIINNKFIDNQLDQCELTLKDLEAIADTFTHILMGIFHSRVEYIEKEGNSKGENKDKNKRQPKKDTHK
ncbi:MAG: HDIG domain-containing protein [Candidatus Omnitrophica bacterium]|nr:HDIG domain-containing protein [Candidatus Omnitrophota bacterium]